MIPFDVSISDIAIAGTGVVATVAGCIKVWYKIRGEHRVDTAAAKQDQGYSGVLAEMRGEVDRLSSRLALISEMLDREMELRRKAENENAQLRIRVAVLEAEVARLSAKTG